MRALIGTFTTYYVAGQPRVTNIQQIAKDVDGTVVAPGARFSLNETAGERTEAKGYVEAPFIADGKIEPSIGGGVSQFSTTLYNAAYFAGLQLDGHRPHSFFIDRYPAGPRGDAELPRHRPDVDERHRRAGPHPHEDRRGRGHRAPLRRQRRAPRARRDRRARAAGHGDFAITVTRVVRYADGDEQRQPFTTRYDKPPADE